MNRFEQSNEATQWSRIQLDNFGSTLGQLEQEKKISLPSSILLYSRDFQAHLHASMGLGPESWSIET